MKQIDLREGARRQHRATAVFAVIQCWLRGLDGIIFDRVHLERTLGLERFKRTRVEWIEEDFNDFFPHQQVYWDPDKYNENGEPTSFLSLWFSRKSLKEFLPKGDLHFQARLEKMPADGPRLGMFQIWKPTSAGSFSQYFEAAVPFFADSVNFDERLLASYLSLLTQGLISPRSLPSLRAGD